MGLRPEHLIDVAAALREHGNDGPIWSVASEQLNVNLLRLPTGDGIVEHVTAGIDVVFVIFEGHGTLTVDGVAYPIGPGRVLVVPQGTMRGLHCTAGPLVYLTCHRRRSGLMPL